MNYLPEICKSLKITGYIWYRFIFWKTSSQKNPFKNTVKCKEILTIFVIPLILTQNDSISKIKI